MWPVSIDFPSTASSSNGSNDTQCSARTQICRSFPRSSLRSRQRCASVLRRRRLGLGLKDERGVRLDAVVSGGQLTAVQRSAQVQPCAPRCRHNRYDRTLGKGRVGAPRAHLPPHRRVLSLHSLQRPPGTSCRPSPEDAQRSEHPSRRVGSQEWIPGRDAVA